MDVTSRIRIKHSCHLVPVLPLCVVFFFFFFFFVCSVFGLNNIPEKVS